MDIKQLRDQDIVCISTSDWENPFGSRQQIMLRLARNNRVLFIEAQLSILHLIFNPLKGIKRISRSMRGMRKRGLLYVYTPPPLFPFGNYFFIVNYLNQRVILFVIRRIMMKIGFREPLLWIYCVNSALLIGKIGEKMAIYYCIDDFPSEIANKKRINLIEKLENNLIARANIVFTCTRTLTEKRRHLRPDIYFIRNGVDCLAFKRATVENTSVFDISTIMKPRICCSGTLDARIDTELIVFLAQSRPQWNFIFIGNNRLPLRDIKLFKMQRNISTLGFKKQEVLPSYICMMDICIIPYRTHGFNRYIFPLKTFEYLAAGKPVVASALYELEEFRDVIKIGQNKEEFLSHIDFLLANPNDGAQREKVAANYSWEFIVEKISNIINLYLSNKVGSVVN